MSAVQSLVNGVIGSLNVHAGDSSYPVRFKETAFDEHNGRLESMFSLLSSDVSANPVALRASALDASSSTQVSFYYEKKATLCKATVHRHL